MPISDPALWNKIENCPLPFRAERDEGCKPPRTCASFADYLCKSGGWTDASARRLVEEYRRYLYLTRVSHEPLSPPTHLEDVFLLHLGLGAGPAVRMAPAITQGLGAIHGLSNEVRLSRYRNARAAYWREFDQLPPKDIWPALWAHRVRRMTDRHWMGLVTVWALAYSAPLVIALLAWLAGVTLSGELGRLGREVWTGDRTPILSIVLYGLALLAFLPVTIFDALAPPFPERRGEG